MSKFTATFNALANEALFTKEMLAAGATQIRRANYATRGIYFQAFTSLATGFERIGKLCLMIDHYIETGGKFPDLKYMRYEICHDLSLIYEKSRLVVERRGVSFSFSQGLDGPIHQNIIKVLSRFSDGDRYSNINLLVGCKAGDDPVSVWHEKVDRVIFETCVSESRKRRISQNARLIDDLISSFSLVSHTSENGTHISSVEDASFRTGMFEAVAPRRQLFVLQIIRYWVELLAGLQYQAMKLREECEIPFFSEIFGVFFNDDTYMKTRKTWDAL